MKNFYTRPPFIWPQAKWILDKLPKGTMHGTYSNDNLTYFEKKSQEVFQNCANPVPYKQRYDSYKNYFITFVNCGYLQSGIILPNSKNTITDLRFKKLMKNLSTRTRNNTI